MTIGPLPTLPTRRPMARLCTHHSPNSFTRSLVVAGTSTGKQRLRTVLRTSTPLDKPSSRSTIRRGSQPELSGTVSVSLRTPGSTSELLSSPTWRARRSGVALGLHSGCVHPLLASFLQVADAPRNRCLVPTGLRPGRSTSSKAVRRVLAPRREGCC